MKNLRTWGSPPFSVAVLHGGPGAIGSAAPVARELSLITGVLEPFETKDSVEGQVEELHGILQSNASLPVIIVGHSWGAYLGFIFTARYPDLVKKLVLVGCPSFESKYTGGLDALRIERLNEQERIEVFEIIEKLAEATENEQDRLMLRLGELYTRADDYDPVYKEDDILKFDFHIHQHVWMEAESLRRTGKMLELAALVSRPVIAIHGDYDPHLAAGVSEPLSRIMPDFQFYLLEKCGHEPWTERHARERFFKILKSCIIQEISK